MNSQSFTLSIVRLLSVTIAGTLCLATTSSSVEAHGFAGDRFFPATLTTDDPFVADELSLPTVSSTHSPDDGGTRETDVSFDLSKRVLPNLALGIGKRFTSLNPHDGPTLNGWSNLELNAKYQFFKSDAHETIVSVGIGSEIGGTGRKLIGADSFTTWTPSLFFGKGFDDLPDAVSLLKPFAITGVLGVSIPGESQSQTVGFDDVTHARTVDIESHPDFFNWGFALEYSLIDLQENVKNIGLPKPFDRMNPLVEFSFQTALDRGQGGQTTGTINPGVIWSGKYFQIGAEVIVPINARSGNEVGFIAQLHFYLDDVFPQLGKPLFGKE